MLSKGTPMASEIAAGTAKQIEGSPCSQDKEGTKNTHGHQGGFQTRLRTRRTTYISENYSSKGDEFDDDTIGMLSDDTDSGKEESFSGEGGHCVARLLSPESQKREIRRHSNRECARRIRKKREETIQELESLCEELKQENEKLMEAACACLVTWQAALENATSLQQQQQHGGEDSKFKILDESNPSSA